MCRNRISVTAVSAVGLLAVLLLCVLLTGCTTWYSLPEEVKLRGRLISNYPQWAVSCTSTGGVSDWKLWQDEQASSLRKLVPSDFAFDDGMSVYDYKGFYQLELGEQTLYIQFDNGYECGLLYLFMEEPTKENYDTPLIIPQPDPDLFSFNGTAKYGFYGGQDIGEFTCTMTKGTQEATGRTTFSYILSIDGQPIVNEKFHVYTEQWFADKQNSVHTWLPSRLYVRKDGSSRQDSSEECNIIGKLSGNHYTSYTHFYSPPALGNNGVYNVHLEQSSYLPAPTYHGGMKEISVDEANQKAVYRLFDGAPDAPQYVELHRDTEDTVLFTWFNLPEGQEDATTNRIDPWEETLYVQK